MQNDRNMEFNKGRGSKGSRLLLGLGFSDPSARGVHVGALYCARCTDVAKLEKPYVSNVDNRYKLDLGVEVGGICGL